MSHPSFISPPKDPDILIFFRCDGSTLVSFSRNKTRACFWGWGIAETQHAHAEVKVAQSCPTLCDPMDCSPTRFLCPWGFPRQECWSGLPFPSPGDVPDPGIEPGSPAL